MAGWTPINAARFLGEAVLFVALDIKTGDLTHLNLSQENERVDLPVLVGLCGFQQALRLRRGQKDDAAVVLLEFADLRRRTLDPWPDSEPSSRRPPFTRRGPWRGSLRPLL
jgi:hypothetical protein